MISHSLQAINAALRPLIRNYLKAALSHWKCINGRLQLLSAHLEKEMHVFIRDLFHFGSSAQTEPTEWQNERELPRANCRQIIQRRVSTVYELIAELWRSEKFTHALALSLAFSLSDEKAFRSTRRVTRYRRWQWQLNYRRWIISLAMREKDFSWKIFNRHSCDETFWMGNLIALFTTSNHRSLEFSAEEQRERRRTDREKVFVVIIYRSINLMRR